MTSRQAGALHDGRQAGRIPQRQADLVLPGGLGQEVGVVCTAGSQHGQEVDALVDLDAQALAVVLQLPRRLVKLTGEAVALRLVCTVGEGAEGGQWTQH